MTLLPVAHKFGGIPIQTVFAKIFALPFAGIDFYCINNRFVLVDLPGYPDPEELAHQGVLKKWEAHWQDLLDVHWDGQLLQSFKL